MLTVHILASGSEGNCLLVSAGVGLLVLFKENHHLKENLMIAALLYGSSVIWGVAIDVLGVTF